jgi:hypothetical protein
MKHFRVRYLCPECGRFHQYTYMAWNNWHAMLIFTAQWRKVNELLGQDFQLPLMTVTEVNYAS